MGEGQEQRQPFLWVHHLMGLLHPRKEACPPTAQLRATWRLTKSRGCSVARLGWPASSLLLEGFLFVWSCHT